MQTVSQRSGTNCVFCPLEATRLVTKQAISGSLSSIRARTGGMSDIFISYVSNDLPRVKPLVDALQQRGWSVRLGPHNPSGRNMGSSYRVGAVRRCVIVLWSRESIQSQWLRTEAEEARRRGILVPAVIDDVNVPLAFKGIQTANLVDSPGMSTGAKASTSPRKPHRRN